MVQFVMPDGRRQSIRLGKMSQRSAEAIKLRVEHLVAAKLTGHAIDDETARWVAGLEDHLHQTLALTGLVQARESTSLGPFIRQYIAGRKDVKRSSVLPLEQVKRSLVEFFGGNRNLRDITPGDADEWRMSLRESLAPSTVSRRVKYAKQIFAFATRKKLISDNPFGHLKAGSRVNKDREFFVTQEMAQRVLDACPDHEWRLIFALSRYGGLRCPSEHLRLRWTDIDWEHERITVHAMKTEHHQGKGTRLVPIFPELMPYLREAFERAGTGAEHVISRYRCSNVNLRTQLERIIARAGLKPWPRMFQNLRSTRQTELEERFPSHVVCAWIGNSIKVAEKHYLQVTEDHDRRALQNAVQHLHAPGRKESQPTRKTPGISTPCEVLQAGATAEIGPEGFEPPTKGL